MKLFILGDSISAGWGVDSGVGYVDLLKDYLEQEYQAVDLWNASIPGSTALDGRQQIIRALKGEVLFGDVIVNFGTNDGMISIWGGSVRVPFAVFEQELESLILLLQQQIKGKLILLGTTVSTDLAIQQSLRCYNEAIKQIAKKKKAIFVDLFALLLQAGIDNVLQGDGLHPNGWGHQLLAQEMRFHWDAVDH